MSKFAKGFLMSAVTAASLGACTEGPAFQETAASRAAIPAGQGRIAVLRTQQVMGFGVRPDVLVDGLPTGKCEVDSVFYVNVAPGQHTVSASTMETSVKASMINSIVLWIRDNRTRALLLQGNDCSSPEASLG